MLFENLVYTTVPGKLPALNDRFANHTIGFFRQYGVGMMGFWTDEIGVSNQLTYITTFDTMADREAKWAEFGSDTKRQQIFAETQVNGPLVALVENTFMRLTPYSPSPQLSSKVQELRVYDTLPGRLPALHDRFANHTMALFERHGIQNVAYWTEDVGTNNRLVYMLGYESLGDREKSWASFGADPDWKKAREASEADGSIVRRSRHRIMRLTDYSPR
jgi:hypothetical protein